MEGDDGLADIDYLIKKSKKGDIASFINLIKPKQEMIYKVAWSYLENNYDVEDCVVDTTITAFDKLHQLKKIDSFYTWYMSILINKCRAYCRNKRKNIYLEDELYEPQDFASYTNVEDRLIAESIMSSLKGRNRDILVLKYLEGFTLREIGIIMKIPENTVKSMLYRTLKKLRIEMAVNKDKKLEV